MSEWLQRLAPNPDAPVRLFCFAHAGGNAGLFREWPGRLPDIDICAIQLPGRANRFGETPIASLPRLADAVVAQIVPLLDRPFAFFGHSMGTALAMAVAQRLRVQGAPLPEHLFMSGRQAPHRPFREQAFGTMPDAALVAEVDRSFGGFPPEVLACPELIEMMLPTLRADFVALEGWRPPVPAPLPVPVTALGGVSDPCAEAVRLKTWQAWSTFPMSMRHFAGGHFYLENRPETLFQLLLDTLACSMAESADSPGHMKAA